MNAMRAMIAAIVALSAVGAAAAPVEFNEISLLVRLHEPESYVVQQVKNRSLLHPLTPRQEEMLAAQGAREALIEALREPALAMSPEEANEYVTQREQLKLAMQQRDAAERKAAAREAEAKAREAAALAARTPAPPPPAAIAEQSDLADPVYFNDAGGYSPYGYGRYRVNRQPFTRPAEVHRAPGLTVVPSGPSGSGDHTVHALSGNAVFVPSR